MEQIKVTKQEKLGLEHFKPGDILYNAKHDAYRLVVMARDGRLEAIIVTTPSGKHICEACTKPENGLYVKVGELKELIYE